MEIIFTADIVFSIVAISTMYKKWLLELPSSSEYNQEIPQS